MDIWTDLKATNDAFKKIRKKNLLSVKVPVITLDKRLGHVSRGLSVAFNAAIRTVFNQQMSVANVRIWQLQETKGTFSVPPAQIYRLLESLIGRFVVFEEFVPVYQFVIIKGQTLVKLFGFQSNQYSEKYLIHYKTEISSWL